MSGREMPTGDHVCAAIAMRLADEAALRPEATNSALGSDPEVSAHVRSCLRCFRTVTELREAPRIAALLREEQPPDPGEFFWAELTHEIGKAWEDHRTPQPIVRATGGVGQRVGAWIRHPIPAALMGAAAAAALTLAVVHRSSRPPMAEQTVEAESDRVVLAAPAVIDESDPWDGLDLADLKSVVAQLSPDSNGPAISDEVPDGSSSATEEIELLEGDDLMAVASALGGRSRI